MGKFEIEYILRNAIKYHALADFVAEFTYLIEKDTEIATNAEIKK